MNSSPSKARVPPSALAAGVKRPAASLLPAFEPLSSSPSLPRPAKRQATADAYIKYPTPIPTSSTGILSSSPPRATGPRPALQRNQSAASERAPLSAVPSVDLNENGDTLLMGRSSSSSQYQLSANRLISRVHVKARYIAAPQSVEPNKVEVVCNGWNGLRLHCQGQTWELSKGDTFTSETEGAEIMIDVQDARVRVNWPRKGTERGDASGHLSDSSWDESPRLRAAAGGADLHSSPLTRNRRIPSPVSPTPANMSTSNTAIIDLMPDGGDDGTAVQIYEDASADEHELPTLNPLDGLGASMVTVRADSFSSDLSEPLSDEDHNPDEENDPIVHSFGPFGANLSNRLASFNTKSPKLIQATGRSSGEEAASTRSGTATESFEPSNPSSQQASPKVPVRYSPVAAAIPTLSVAQTATIANHMINQLAFSRLSSTPLSAIMNNLPAGEKRDLTVDTLRQIIEATACIGVITRQGKDAAGKPLESEYYYVSEQDADEQRRLAVTDGLRKPSLRNCRKQHKVRCQSHVECWTKANLASNIIGNVRRLLECQPGDVPFRFRFAQPQQCIVLLDK